MGKREDEQLENEPPKPQPLAEVPGGRGQQQLEAVVGEATQIVARQAEVAFEMRDGRFNGAASPEALPHGLALAGALPIGVTIGGSLQFSETGSIGSSFPPMLAGAISSEGDIRPFRIGGDVAGGGFADSGSIKSTNGDIASVVISGSIRSGQGGAFIAAGGDIGPVRIGGEFFSDSGNAPGQIKAAGSITSVIIGGSLLIDAMTEVPV